MSKRIAVIGAGPSGLAAIKSCKEAGFTPVCYERNSDPGGLWRYHDDDLDGVASVMKTTIINTSKEVSSFSDFPPPPDFPNFMHNTRMFDYFMLYARHFDLLRHIRFNLEVVKVEKCSDFATSGRWTVSVKSTRTEAPSREECDAVMVCVGHHVFPKVPSFPGQERFKGSVTHTHSLKSCERYADQRVVVVGVGNSGADAAVDSTFVAEKVYLSTRRGTWLYGRLGEKGLPYDISFTRLKTALFGLLPFSAQCSLLESALNKRFDHGTYKLKPQHRVYSAHPTLSDHLPGHILSGRVEMKGDIDRFEEGGVVFAGEDAVTEVDAVVLATGYHIRFPFLGGDVVPIESNRVSLYKYAIPPALEHHTLAVIALIQPLGPIFPVAEMQCRWFLQIQLGNLSLPSRAEMAADIARKNQENAWRYVASTRHTIQVDLTPFMDELSSMIGAKPSLCRLALTDPSLFWAVLTGPILPYHYRLRGPFAWPGARKAILSVMDRVYSPLCPEAKVVSKKKAAFRGIVLMAAFLGGLGVFYGREQVLNAALNNFQLLKLQCGF